MGNHVWKKWVLGDPDKNDGFLFFFIFFFQNKEGLSVYKVTMPKDS